MLRTVPEAAFARVGGVPATPGRPDATRVPRVLVVPGRRNATPVPKLPLTRRDATFTTRDRRDATFMGWGCGVVAPFNQPRAALGSGRLTRGLPEPLFTVLAVVRRRATLRNTALLRSAQLRTRTRVSAVLRFAARRAFRAATLAAGTHRRSALPGPIRVAAVPRPAA